MKRIRPICLADRIDRTAHSDCVAKMPFAILILMVFVGLGCVPRRESSVVLYSASDREYATPILDAFDRITPGTEVARQFDVESSKTLGLVTRIEQESGSPRCDVFWNNEIIHTIRLQKQGLLASRRWKVPDNWPSNYRAKDGTWIGYAARARVLLINKTKLPDRKAWPTSVLALADKQWRHRCGLANPIYGTTATHMSVLATHATSIRPNAGGLHEHVSDSGLAWDTWAKAVADNAVVLAGNKQVALSVSSGELDWGLTDTDDAAIEMESGHSVEIVFPDQLDNGFGTLFVPNTISVIRGGPNPTAADALADYLVSEKVESRLTMGNSAQFPVWPGAEHKSRLLKESFVRWAEVDFEKAAAGWSESLARLKVIFNKN
ncbi:MAG: extracellular solute-binding protein [Pirellula sp.]